MQNESKELLLEKLNEINQWENEKKDLWFWEKISRLPFKILDKITPKFLQEKIGYAIDEVGNYIHTGGKYLINEKAIFQKFEQKGYVNSSDPHSVTSISDLPIVNMDTIARDLRDNRSTFAGFQGATTGIGGIFTLALDIPFLLGLSLKTLQEIAVCYGYDPNDQKERIFIVKCLQFASSDIVGKQALLVEFETFSTRTEHAHVFSEIQGWREVVTTYRDNFGWKKLFQMVPIAGVVFGAFINKSMIEEISDVGMMLYRKRKIIDRLNQIGNPALLAELKTGENQ